VLAAGLFLVGSLGAACTSGGKPGTPPGGGDGIPVRPLRGGSATFGVVGAPATLDPYSPQATDLTRTLARPLYPSLYRFRPDGSTEPDLARSLVRVRGRTTVTLRGALWDDGRPITARDVVLSVRRARPPSGFAAFLSARALGPRTVELRGRVRAVERALASAAYVLPRGRAGERAGGPYRVSSHRPGLELVLERNPRWSGASALLGRVTVQFVQSVEQLLLLLEAGKLDAAAPPSTVNLAETVAPPVRVRGALGWESVLLDFGGSSLGRRERAAVAGGLDRAEIEAVFARGDGRRAFTIAPGPGPGGADGPWRGALTRRALPSETVELSAPAGDTLLELLRRAAYTQLSDEGMDVNAVTVDPSTFYASWEVGEDTDVALRRRAGAPPWGRVDEGLSRLDAVPLLQVETFLAWRPELRGLRPNPTIEGPLWNVERWWRSAGG
jgi:hypothetical protein